MHGSASCRNRAAFSHFLRLRVAVRGLRNDGEYIRPCFKNIGKTDIEVMKTDQPDSLSELRCIGPLIIGLRSFNFSSIELLGAT